MAVKSQSVTQYYNSSGNKSEVSLSQFERDCIADRTREGLAAARARGRTGGRLRVSCELMDKAIRLYESKEYTVAEIEELTSVKRATLYQHLK